MNDNDLKLISALLTNATVRDAAAACKVSEATAYRRLKEPDFRQALREARYRAFGLALMRLQAASGLAVETLQSLMADEDAPPTARVNAAVATLRLADAASARPEELDRALDRQAQNDALRKGDKAAYLAAGGDEAGWSLHELARDAWAS